MENKTLEKKLRIFEQAFSADTGGYYSINLTRNVIEGKMYQIINNQKYCINDAMGLPENARFTEVTEMWEKALPAEERKGYLRFMNMDQLMEHYQKGEKHLSHTYWAKAVTGKEVYVKQSIIMYEEEETGDILAISYFIDLTEQKIGSMELGTERRFLDVIFRDYTTVHYADLNEDFYEPLKIDANANASKISQIQIRQKVNYTDSVRHYCEKYVSDEYKKRFAASLDRKYLIKELSQADRFVFRYQSTPNMAGHRYFEVQIIRINQEKFDGKVIVAFHHIDDIVTKEQTYQLELEKTAYQDALTGIGNRSAFTKEMQTYGENPEAACIVADVNNLKLCNDRYGHKAGDKFIADAADCICRGFEKLGKCYRIGGDEFCVLIRKGREKTIRVAIEKVKCLIEEKNAERAMPLSIACGYAIRDNEEETMEQLFNRSDEMMYNVKYRMKQQFPVYCEERIKNYLNVLNILAKSTDDYLYMWSIDRNEFWYFGGVEKEYALQDKGKPMCSAEEVESVVYQADLKMLHEDLGLIVEGKKMVHDMNYRWVNRQGDVVWINCRGKVINDDKGKPFVMIGRVSDTALRYLYHPLTKLFNKNKMLLDLKKDFMERNRGYFMFAGIDNPGSINLRHGRNYGDEAIKKCARIFEDYVTLNNVWHVENNCFAMYLDVDSREEVQKIYEKLNKKLMGFCTISAGIVPNRKQMFGDENNLYDCAEITYEKAKSNGMHMITYFSQEDLEQRIKEQQFLEEMQESVEHGCRGFYLCYQPQIKTGNYNLYGAEALLRYHSEIQGEVYPNEFIPLLEKSKLINQVGMWVLETALQQCRHWRKQMPEFRISVNFSAVQLRERKVAQDVLDILAKTGLPGNALTIEITESVQLQEFQYYSEIFNCWREAGIELSIDDFGTGYASMSYLKQLNVNEIKIDRLFVKGVEEATYNYRLISNMIEFAKSNAIRICCEGVEDVKELTVLEGLAPNLIQGYLFSKPCRQEEFERSFIDYNTEDYREHEAFVQKIYHYKDKMHVIYFNTKNILRETALGLWIIRINEEEGYYEMHVDETMEHIMSVDRKYTPQECYDYWFSRIKDGYQEYVVKNVNRMIEADKVIQLSYPWKHPAFGEVTVRCCGKRVEDSDGMITLEGYHRITSNIEQN